jgi:hypothetical protein
LSIAKPLARFGIELDAKRIAALATETGCVRAVIAGGCRGFPSACPVRLRRVGE